MSRWVNWQWRAIEMSPDNRQMNPGETRRLHAESPAARIKKYHIINIVFRPDFEACTFDKIFIFAP
jgi:hypothetical protein